MIKANHGKLHGLGDATTDAISQAIAREEGFYVANSIAQRNNNPGNLRAGVGQSGTANGFAVFPDATTGWAALGNQVQLNVARGLNLYQFFGGGLGYPGYAPSADSNNPTAYADFVASQTGIDPNVPLNQIAGGVTDTTANPAIDPTTGLPVDTSNSGDAAGAFGLSTNGLALVGIGVAAAAALWLFGAFRG